MTHVLDVTATSMHFTHLYIPDLEYGMGGGWEIHTPSYHSCIIPLDACILVHLQYAYLCNVRIYNYKNVYHLLPYNSNK